MNGRKRSAEHSTTLELYKLAIEMADRVSARRGVANSFYLSLQSAIVAALGFLSAEMAASRVMLLGVCFAGVVTSITWFLLLRSYRDLNRAKFAVILKMEENLPYRVYGAEWDHLKKDRVPGWQGRYAEFGAIERAVPLVFLLLNVALGVYVWCL